MTSRSSWCWFQMMVRSRSSGLAVTPATAVIAFGYRPTDLAVKTVSWWRNTMISRSLDRPERTASQANAAMNQ